MYFMQNMEDLSINEQNVSFKSAVCIKVPELPYYNVLSAKENLASDEFYACKIASYKGTEYKIGDFVTKSEQNMRKVELFEIKDLLVFDNELFVTCQAWFVGDYSHHFASIEVHKIQSKYEIHNVTLFDGPPINVYNIDMKNYIRLKKFFV